MLVTTSLAVLGQATFSLTTVYTALGILIAFSVVIGILTNWVRKVYKTIKRFTVAFEALEKIIVEWNGTPADNGDPGTPTFPVRMANMERAIAGMAYAPRRRQT